MSMTPDLGKSFSRTGVPQFSSVARFWRPGPRGRRRGRDVDHAPSIHLRVGNALSEVRPRRAPKPARLWLPEGPARLARGGVDRDDLPTLTDNRVQHAVHEDRVDRAVNSMPGPKLSPRKIQATFSLEKLDALIWFSEENRVCPASPPR